MKYLLWIINKAGPILASKPKLFPHSSLLWNEMKKVKHEIDAGTLVMLAYQSIYLTHHLLYFIWLWIKWFGSNLSNYKYLIVCILINTLFSNVFYHLSFPHIYNFPFLQYHIYINLQRISIKNTMTFFASHISLTRIMWDRFTYACLTSRIRIDQSRVTKDGQSRKNKWSK